MDNISYMNLTLIKRIGCSKRTKQQNRGQKDMFFYPKNVSGKEHSHYTILKEKISFKRHLCRIPRELSKFS